MFFVFGFVLYVCVFFILTDRASVIPNSIRGCQSGTWSTVQETNNYTKHMSEEDRRKTLDREFGIPPAASHPIPPRIAAISHFHPKP